MTKEQSEKVLEIAAEKKIPARSTVHQPRGSLKVVDAVETPKATSEKLFVAATQALDVELHGEPKGEMVVLY
jgi:hypothetical protein